MDFVHDPYIPGETIAAVATPPGEGGVAIIRISGHQALEIADKVFSGPIKTYKTHTAHFGQIINTAGSVVDDVLVLVMKGARSYAGEDTVEVHCHGGSLITRRVLEVILQAGARAAKPGEFTFKAFMNGRLDLTQAEAVQGLISAKNDLALNAAEDHLRGKLSQKVKQFQQELTQVAAILEAWVDFPEEGLEFATLDELSETLSTISHSMKRLIDSYHNGKIIHDGLSLCLIGRPNVGKSSLMNALLDKERAIVSAIPGTTRDIVEDHFRLEGLNFRLIDTAGIRHAEDIIEQEGVRRSKAAMEKADLVLFVLDSTEGFTEEDRVLAESLPKEKTVVIWNKIDIAPPEALDTFPHIVALSAKEKLGLDVLHQTINTVIWHDGMPSKEEIVLTNVRHKEALENAYVNTLAVIDGLKENVSPEFLTFEMRDSLHHLGKIIGTNISEDVLTSIFSTFCIGK